MKTFVKVLFWLLGIIAVLVIISFFLPKTSRVGRSILIKSNPDVIYGLTCDFTKWHLWVPWTKETDSTIVYESKGTPCQVGTTWSWEGKTTGTGMMTATELIPGQLVACDLEFEHGKYKSKGKITLEKQGDSCKVTWSYEGDLGYNPMARYMGLFMERMVAPDYEKGLAKLKKISEARANWPKIEETIMHEQVALLIRDSAGPKNYSQIFAKDFGELNSFIKGNNLKCTGAPFAIYLKWDSVTMNSTMDIGFSVEKADKGKGRIRVEKIPEQKVLLAHYFGSYEKMGIAYHVLDQVMKEDGKEKAGGPWEIYTTDPMSEKDTSKWETSILFPVK